MVRTAKKMIIQDCNRKYNVPLYEEDLDRGLSDAEIKRLFFPPKDNCKCPGKESLVAEIFKITYDIINPYLKLLFNNIFFVNGISTVVGRRDFSTKI